MKKLTYITTAGALLLSALLLTNTAFAQTSSATFSRDLTVGSTGADVTALQQILATAGVFNTAPTGFFGNVTKAAVASWQARFNLPSTGYFGPLSRHFLNSIDPRPISIAPTLTNILPMATTTGAVVTLTGTGFTATGNNINFGVFRAVSNLSSTDGTHLTFTVPTYGGANCEATAPCPTWAMLFPKGGHLLTVKNANGTSNAFTFTLK